MSQFNLKNYLSSIDAGDTGTSGFSYAYLKAHQKRFSKTIEFLENCNGNMALEIGATDFFQIYLNCNLKFNDVWASIFEGNLTRKIRKQVFSALGYSVTNTVVDIQLEDEFFPIGAPCFDLVMMCEVLEHMDVDPMFCLCELNRITKIGGKLLITTPNSCSARNAYKCCLGYRPHFFMQYNKDRNRYRHNFEHDVHSVIALVKGAGYRVLKCETHDVFEETSEEALAFLQRSGASLENRGDDIFILAEKISDPIERWPAGIYI